MSGFGIYFEGRTNKNFRKALMEVVVVMVGGDGKREAKNYFWVISIIYYESASFFKKGKPGGRFNSRALLWTCSV